MNIFADNPILGRELRSRLRLRKVRGNPALAVLFSFILLVIVWFSVKGIIGIMNGRADDARDLWSYLIVFLLLLTLILAPALLSTAVTQEREQQTWETLAITRLTSAQILLGKWLGRLLLTLLPIIILLPFLIACSIRGALEPILFFLSLLFLVVTAAGYGTLGLLCSFFARKSVSATVAALTLTLVICIGTPIIAQLMQNFLRDASANYSPQDPIILWVNPFVAAAAVVSSFEPQSVGMLGVSDADNARAMMIFYFVVTVLATALALVLMMKRYRRATLE